MTVPTVYEDEAIMVVGYARVSTGEQLLDVQRAALKKAGCEHLFHDEMSSVKAERPGLVKAWQVLRPGDTLVVWRLDRLGCSLTDLITHMEELHRRKIGFKSLHESIDTTSPTGRLQFHLFSALAEFERDLIRERTMAGLRAARARGRKGGRKQAMTKEKIKLAASLIKDKSNTVTEICKTLGISRSTLYRYVSPTGEIRAAQRSQP